MPIRISALRLLLSLVLATVLSVSLQAITFDVTSVSDLDGAFYTKAEGTSNGVGWSISDFRSWNVNTTTDGTYNGFTGANFVPALPNTDRLHTFGTTMNIVFDEAISSILFYLKENGGSSSLDFGLTPTLVSGSVGISGTKVTGTLAGGVVRFSGLNTSNLLSTATIFDGMDAAWVVESTVGVPDTGSTALLLGFGLAALGMIRRKRG